MVFFLYAALTACTTDPPPPAKAHTPQITAPELPLPGRSIDDPCTKQCIRQNMARAVDALVIEADCARACDKDDRSPAPSLTP